MALCGLILNCTDDIVPMHLFQIVRYQMHHKHVLVTQHLASSSQLSILQSNRTLEHVVSLQFIGAKAGFLAQKFEFCKIVYCNDPTPLRGEIAVYLGDL